MITDPSHPASQTVVLIAAGVLLLCFRRYWLAFGFFAFGISWIVLCAMPVFAALLEHGLEQQYPRHEAFAYPMADAIVILGGGEAPEFDKNVSDNLVATTRTGFGLALFRAARAPTILLSGGDDEAIEMAHQLRKQGVPTQALQIESLSATTHQNAALSAAILKRIGYHRILLVTSALSMPRAAACFRREGLEVFAAPPIETTKPTLPGVSWRPQAAALIKSGRCLHEYIGLLVYKLLGWA